MLIPAAGLSSRDLAALADLDRRVVAHDGGRLKLEYSVLQQRSGDQVEDLLWWDGDRLLGFLGIYAFGPPEVEMAGMVDPDARRQGIGSRLLEAALPLAEERGYRAALLVCSPAGRAFAEVKGATLRHCEHFMVLGPTPAGEPKDPAVTLRPAELDDLPAVARLLTSAFGNDPGPDFAKRLESTTDTTLVIERDGAAVGTIRLSRHEGTGAVYGFAVDPALQGRGIGGDVLGRVCRQLREEGFARVTLEVATENDRALGLYTSTGFRRETTEDYWALELSRQG